MHPFIPRIRLFGNLRYRRVFFYRKSMENMDLKWKAGGKDAFILHSMHPKVIEHIVGEGVLRVAIEKYTDFSSLAELMSFASKNTLLEGETTRDCIIRVVTPALINALYSLLEAHLDSNIIEMTEKDFV